MIRAILSGKIRALPIPVAISSTVISFLALSSFSFPWGWWLDSAGIAGISGMSGSIASCTSEARGWHRSTSRSVRVFKAPVRRVPVLLMDVAPELPWIGTFASIIEGVALAFTSPLALIVPIVVLIVPLCRPTFRVVPSILAFVLSFAFSSRTFAFIQ